MTAAVHWDEVATDGVARSGLLRTPHGAVSTPGFMPVGTRGTVRTVDVHDLRSVGAEMLLANTYHLMLRPGAGAIAALGELQSFMGWDGPVLTDSGGFQVFSLDPVVEENGVRFQSTYDGSGVFLTPEDAVRIQEQLGSDIAMALDVLIGLPASRESVASAMERTLRWAERSLGAKKRSDRGLFGIVQGGVDPELRGRSAAATAALRFDGYGIGGLSVGESADARDTAIDAVVPELPPDRVRYVMGLGDTEGMLAAVTRGIDLFDCVLPTRLARHGKALHPDGDFSIKRADLATSEESVDSACGCLTCTTYSRGYLRHLFSAKEPLGPRLLTIHNLSYTFDLLAGARKAIADGSLSTFAAERVARRRTPTTTNEASGVPA